MQTYLKGNIKTARLNHFKVWTLNGPTLRAFDYLNIVRETEGHHVNFRDLAARPKIALTF